MLAKKLYSAVCKTGLHGSHAASGLLFEKPAPLRSGHMIFGTLTTWLRQKRYHLGKEEEVDAPKRDIERGVMGKNGVDYPTVRLVNRKGDFG